jgi:DNA-binding transcriptional MerR regulator
MVEETNHLLLNQSPTEELLVIYEKMTKYELRQDDTPFNSRMLNYYSKKGLLFESEERTSKTRRTFNLAQIIWFNILEQLLELGYNTDNILLIKNIFQAHKYIDKEKAKIYEFFPYYCSHSVLYPYEFFLFIDAEGSHDFITNFATQNIRDGNWFTDRNHIVIPFTKIVLKQWNYFCKKKIEIIRPEVTILKNVDNAILKTIRKSEYDNVKITKDEKAITLTVIERESPENLEQVLRIAKDTSVQIGFGSKSGKASSVTKKVRKKFNL